MNDARPETPVFPHTVVLASAGSGKTFALTSRFIGLMAAGAPPERILASTFTRKAAGEILRKVVQRLGEGAASAEGARTLGEQCGVPRLSRERCLDLLAVLARSLHRLSIGTLDSFTMRIVGAMALELGGSAARRLLEDDEDRSLRAQAVGEVLRTCDRAEMLALLRLLSPGKLVRSVHDALSRAIDAAYPAFLNSTDDAWLAVRPPPGGGGGLSAAALESAVQRLEGLAVPKNADGSPNLRWRNAVAAAAASLRESAWEKFLEAGIAPRILAGEARFAEREIDTSVRGAFDPLLRHCASVLLGDLSRRNAATRRFLGHFHEAYARLKRERTVMTFDDVPRLILSSNATQDLIHLYYRLDSRFDHILLDEFQDTSLDQWRLLKPLCEEAVAHRAPERSLFCVGDTKQCLYAWRNAEPWLLPSIARNWKRLGVVEDTLTKSRRSSSVVIDTVNLVMGGLGQSPALASSQYPDDVRAAARWGEQWEEHATWETGLHGFARLAVAPRGAGSAQGERNEIRIRAAADRITDIHSRLPPLPAGTIGVLFRSKKSIPLLRHELKLRGIEASEEGGNPLTDSPAVSVALSALTLADHPAHTAAAFHAATSPLGAALGLGPDSPPAKARAVASQIRRSLVEHGYAGALERWWLAMRGDMGRRDTERFNQLVELGSLYDARQASAGTGGGGGAAALRPSDFVTMVRERHVEDPSASPVRLMTIHASKGLEFSCVVLPDLDGALVRYPDGVIGRRTGADDGLDGDEMGRYEAVTVAPKKCLLALDDDLRRLHADWRVDQIGEELCVLYVAMTRAIHALEMIIDPSDKSDVKLTMAGLIRGALAPGVAAARESTLWSIGDSNWAELASRLAPSSGAAPAVAKEGADGSGVPRLAVGRERTRFRPRRSPSSLVHAAVDSIVLPAALADGGTGARDRGRIIHAWFELIEWIEDGVPADDLLRSAAQRIGFAPGLDVEALLARFRRSLRDPTVVDVLSLEAWRERSPGSRDADVEAIREQEFAVHASASGQPSLLTGRFDRLLVVRTGGIASAAEVIDFKTDAIDVRDPVAVAARVELYRPQLDAYQRAAAELLGVAAGRVGARLVFVDVGEDRCGTEDTRGRGGRPTP